MEETDAETVTGAYGENICAGFQEMFETFSSFEFERTRNSSRPFFGANMAVVERHRFRFLLA